MNIYGLPAVRDEQTYCLDRHVCQVFSRAAVADSRDSRDSVQPLG